jgi:hypothetical protein
MNSLRNEGSALNAAHCKRMRLILNDLIRYKFGGIQSKFLSVIEKLYDKERILAVKEF